MKRVLDLRACDRPREKLKNNGPESLSYFELLLKHYNFANYRLL